MLCQACHINPAPVGYLCHDCRADLRQCIGEIPLDIRTLRQLADRTARIGEPQPGGSHAFAPLPVDETAMQVMDDLKTWLQTTDSDLRAKRGLRGPEDWQWHWTNITGDWTELVELPATPRRYDELKRIIRKARRLLTPPDELAFAGTCGACGQPVYAPPSRAEAYCRCGNIINVESNRADAQDRLRNMVVTTTPDGAARWVRDNIGETITRKDVNNWRRRGKLHARPTDDDGYWEYPVAELIDLAEAKERK